MRFIAVLATWLSLAAFIVIGISPSGKHSPMSTPLVGEEVQSEVRRPNEPRSFPDDPRIALPKPDERPDHSSIVSIEKVGAMR